MNVELSTTTNEAPNCVIVGHGEAVTALGIIAYAVQNEAVILDRDEAGDDQYVVRFPNQDQELYTFDKLMATIRAGIKK